MLQKKDPADMSAEEIENALNGVEQTQPADGAESVNETTEPANSESVDSEAEASEEVVTEEIPQVADSVKKGDPVSGLKKDIGLERERRRQAEDRAKIAEKQLADVHARLAALEKPAVVPQYIPEKKVESQDEIDDDSLVDGKTFKQTASKIKDLERKLLLAEQAEEKRRSLQESERRSQSDREAREKYSEDNVGSEYAYQKILADVLVPILESGTDEAQELSLLITKAKNPAETAYRYGLAKVYDPAKVIGKKVVEGKKSAPLTLGQAQSAGGKNNGNLEDADIEKMNDKQLQDYFERQGR